MKPNDQATDLLRQLVACRSDQREEALVALLAGWLKTWGAQTAIQEVHPGRPNLVATFPGKDPAHALLLDAHSDTVGGDASFEPRVEAGQLHGRGACDTKGPMTAMLLGLREVLDHDGQPPWTVHFVSTCNEELGATGAHALMARGLRADLAVVAEPTELRIVHAHKGALRVKLHTTGVAAHSSNPAAGVNAIYKMRAVLDRLERFRPALRHPRLGPPTLSVGTIHGGTQVNVVPAHCTIEVDRRLVPGENRDEVVRELVEGSDVRSEVTEYYPPLDEDTTSPAAQRLAAAAQRALGRAEFDVVAYATNAGVFQAAGIPSVVFGPGSIAQAHTRDEFIELDQVVQASQVITAFIRGEP